jgi:hypothetical protein
MIYSLGVLEEQDIVKKSLRHPPSAQLSSKALRAPRIVFTIAAASFEIRPPCARVCILWTCGFTLVACAPSLGDLSD